MGEGYGHRQQFLVRIAHPLAGVGKRAISNSDFTIRTSSTTSATMGLPGRAWATYGGDTLSRRPMPSMINASHYRGLWSIRAWQMQPPTH